VHIDEKLKEFATTTQAKYIDAVNKAGSIIGASKLLACARSTIQDGIKSVRKKAATKGYAPEFNMTQQAPDPFLVKGVSSYYGKDGQLKGQWVKTALDNEKLQEAITQAIDALTQDVKRVAPSKRQKRTNADLCNLYTITDAHIGARCWKPETGGDWDLTIAEDLLTGGFKLLIETSPNAKIGIVNVLGDLLHFDSLKAITPQHGNILDGDGRYSKVIAVAVRIIRHVIQSALRKHEMVIVVIMEGNHDEASSVWLRHLFGLLFENEPRVDVKSFELPYFAMQHGQTMLGFHHGHIRKNEALPSLFAAQFPKVWGNTTKRYAHTGHRHHKHELEYSGIHIIQHATFAARDAYAARGGWISDRSITSITYHSEHGEAARNTITPEMIV
jgi:hypothetical protein